MTAVLSCLKNVVRPALIICLFAGGAVAQTIDIGLFNSSVANTLEIRVRPNQTLSAQVISSMTFTIRWQTSSGASLGAIQQQIGAQGAAWCPSEVIPLSKSPDGQIDNGGFRYQTINGFGFTQLQNCSFAAGYSWPANVETVIARIPVTGATGCVSFNIVNDSYTAANNKSYYSSVGGVPSTGAIYSTGASSSLLIALKAYLDGAFDSSTGLMRDDLRVGGLIPLNQPYNFAPFSYTGTESVASSVLTTTGNNAIVDWVLLEVRNNTTPTTIVARRAALIQRDGDVVDLDGISPVSVCTTAATYRIALRHRNHLGVMTGSGVALSTTSTLVDFTLSGTSTFGTNARRTVGSVRTLWGGNANSNTTVSYSGGSNDRTQVLNTLGASTFLTPLNAYHNSDVTMNGFVSYSGANNDRTQILNTLGASTFLTPVTEQLP
jgi:hypothetical protein